MKSSAWVQAKDLLHNMADEIEILKNTKDFHATERSWRRFLNHCAEIYFKFKRGCKGHPISEQWYKNKEIERSSDELLKYIHHARNNIHSTDNITTRAPGQVVVHGNGVYAQEGILKVQTFYQGVVGSDGVPRMQLTTEYDASQFNIVCVSGEPPRVTYLPAHVTPLPVWGGDRKKELINPPTTHLGKQIEFPLPLQLAELSTQYFSQMTQEAWELIPKNKYPPE